MQDTPDSPAPETPAASVADAAPDAVTSVPVKRLYEVTCAGPLKIGAVLCWRNARLPVLPAVADAINATQPGSLLFLGVA